MKRLSVLIGLATVLAVPAMQAAMQVTLYQNLSDYSYGVGGEFSARPNAALLAANPVLAGYVAATADPAAVDPYFQTFCIELAEEFTPGSSYNVTINDKALYNGGQFPAGDPISLGTAWLYSRFAGGTLDGYDYTYGSGRMISAGDLQQAIWYCQGEVDSLVNGSANGTAFYAAAVSALGATIDDPANGAYAVVALNLWVPNPDGSNGAAAQDQLMIVPQISNVPEPSASSLGICVLVTLALYRVRAFYAENGRRGRAPAPLQSPVSFRSR